MKRLLLQIKMPLHLRVFKNWNWAYVLGELVLVTLGVLLALAVSNWSNRKTETKKEAFHLQDLERSLRSDLDELRAIIAFHEATEQSCMLLYQHLLAAKPWQDTVTKWISHTGDFLPFFPQRAAFENLKSLDFNLIKNDQLRASIFQVYEERFEQQRLSEQALIRRIEQHWIPMLSTKVRMLEDYSIEPVDYTAILQQPQYRNYLGLLQGDHNRIVGVAKVAAMDVEILIRQIEVELSRINAGRRRTQEPRTVTMQLEGFPQAKKVALSGTFNNWHHTKDMMQRNEKGWQLTLSLKPGVYMYKFIVDGEWIEDPANPDVILSEYDNYNSVLKVQ